MTRIFLAFVFLFCTGILSAQETVFYRLVLKDKGESSYNVNRPEEFLSRKSIDRRTRQNFPVDETDLPISPAYFEALTNAGASVQTFSKWVKTVVAQINEEDTARVRNLPFIDDMYPVFRGVLLKNFNREEEEEDYAASFPSLNFDDYGSGQTQIALNNGYLLHQQGYKGKGMTIAVLDGGFLDTDKVNYFNQNQILGVKNFTHQNENPLRSDMDHGTKVLSCMLANKPGDMIGTAPDAEYYLFKTEVNGSEFPVEEDYWVAALEYADSLGVDIVSTSLGYFTFDDPAMNHTQSQLDGKTVPASRAAAMAAYKGMILCNSAGNEKNKNWVKIVFPSDAENILTVGAVAKDSVCTAFSSSGYASNGRVKPDVMAMGLETTLVGTNGKGSGNGTSFSCPIISGLTASLWQALPDLSSLELLAFIRQSADRYRNPNEEYGYGIPDFFKAYSKGISGLAIPSPNNSGCLVFDSRGNRIYILDNQDVSARLSIYTSMGIKILNVCVSSDYIDTSALKKGAYIARFQNGDKQCISKFIKN